MGDKIYTLEKFAVDRTWRCFRGSLAGRKYALLRRRHHAPHLERISDLLEVGRELLGGDLLGQVIKGSFEKRDIELLGGGLELSLGLLQVQLFQGVFEFGEDLVEFAVGAHGVEIGATGLRSIDATE